MNGFENTTIRANAERARAEYLKGAFARYFARHNDGARKHNG